MEYTKPEIETTKLATLQIGSILQKRFALAVDILFISTISAYEADE